MLKYFIQVIEVTFSAAMILSLLFAVLFLLGAGKIGARGLLSRLPIAGILLGTAAGLVLSVFRYTTPLVNREYWSMGELVCILASGVALAVMLWIRRGRTTTGVGLVRTILFSIFAASVMFNITPDIFLYITEFVPAGESVFSTDLLFKLTGYLAGLAVVCFAFFAVYKAGKKFGLKPTLIVMTVQMILFAVGALATIFQFLVARRIIPTTDLMFDFIILAVNHRNIFLFASALFGALVLIGAWIVSKRGEASNSDFPNPAEKRKSRIAGIRIRRWCRLGIICVIMVVLSATVIKAANEREVVLSPAEDMDIHGQEILISLEQVNDGHLHRFAYNTSDGTEVRFIVIKKNDVAFGVGLDACDICGQTGYYERKGEVICKLCDVVMNKQTIGFAGGCNPVPLNYVLDGKNMVVMAADLEAEKSRFQ